MTDSTTTPSTTTEQPSAALTVVISPNDKGNPPGKLADAELHFVAGPLVGLKLIGFGIWERRTGGGRNVTFPARQYSVNGERRSFALLRPVGDSQAQDTIRNLVLRAFEEYEGPRTSTRISFDEAGSVIDQNGITLAPPLPEAPRQACTNLSADQLQEITTSPNPDPGILMHPLESSPDRAEEWSIDARMSEAAAKPPVPQAPRARRF